MRGSFRDPRFNAIISVFLISRVRRSPVIPVERTGGATRQQSQLPTAGQQPSSPSELDYDTCPDIMSSQICQYEGTTKPVS